jgi:hypothetical protein
MAAPGAGVIFYQRTEKPYTLLVGCARRSARVGEGFGISAGGFAELKPVLAAPVGAVRNLLEEAWRETVEELPGVEAAISFQEFYDNAQPLLALVVRTPDENRIHAGCYYAVELIGEQRLTIQALPQSEETVHPLEFFELVVQRTAQGSVQSQLATFGGFYHAHEEQAFRVLAEYAARNRLWTRS